MRAKLAVGVGVLVALAGVLSVAANGGEPSEAVMWAVAALVPAAIVALGAVPSGYSSNAGDEPSATGRIRRDDEN